MTNTVKTKLNFMGNAALVLALVIAGLIVAFGQTKQKELRLAYVMSSGGTSQAGAEEFARLVEERTNGNINVRLYPNGVLGNERILVESLVLRGVDMVITGSAIIGWYAPEYGVIEAPFLFRDYVHLDMVLDGQIGKDIEAAIRRKFNLHFLTHFHRGPRYLTTTNRKVYSPNDLSGLKLRVPELPVYIRSWAAFGANPTPVAFNDMFMALRQGVVEGQENPLEVIYTSHLHETQNYIMETEHLLGFYSIVVGHYFYEKFSEHEQKIIIQAAKEAGRYQNSLLEKFEEEYKKRLIESGVEFVEVNREAFERLALEKLPPVFEEDWATGIFETIQNLQ